MYKISHPVRKDRYRKEFSRKRMMTILQVLRIRYTQAYITSWMTMGNFLVATFTISIFSYLGLSAYTVFQHTPLACRIISQNNPKMYFLNGLSEWVFHIIFTDGNNLLLSMSWWSLMIHSTPSSVLQLCNVVYHSICGIFNNMTSVFHVFVLLLIMILVKTLSK